MTDRVKNVLVCGIMAFFVLAFSIATVIKPENEISVSERRQLATKPQLTGEAFFSGRYMDDFEEYAKDQFSLRDDFRTVKALVATKLFGKKDNNGIYMTEGHASALEYPLDNTSVDNLIAKLDAVYDKYMAGKNMKVYLSIVPDKNLFLAEKNGYPALDYNEMIDQVSEGLSYMTYVDIVNTLGIEDYYKTDTHWKQECLIDVAGKLKKAMKAESANEYEVKTLDNPFYGVYNGQSAFDLEPDIIKYLSNDIIDNMKVYDYENDKEISVYDMEKAYSKDPYELFLSGPISLITIENDKVDNKRELIIFRDSFGSSIAPLIAEVYSKVTLVDIRYMRSDILDRYIDFENQDVLFLYSTMVINNSETFK